MPLRGRSRSNRKLNESHNSGGAAAGREDSPAYRAALARLNDVTRDKEAIEADLMRERLNKDNVVDDL